MHSRIRKDIRIFWLPEIEFHINTYQFQSHPRLVGRLWRLHPLLSVRAVASTHLTLSCGLHQESPGLESWLALENLSWYFFAIALPAVLVLIAQCVTFAMKLHFLFFDHQYCLNRSFRPHSSTIACSESPPLTWPPPGIAREFLGPYQIAVVCSCHMISAHWSTFWFSSLFLKVSYHAFLYNCLPSFYTLSF